MPLVINKVMGNGSVQQVIEAPATHPWGSMNLVASNQNGTSAQIEIFITSAGGPSPVDSVEPGAAIPAKGRYELSCRLIQAGEKVFVNVPAGVSVRAEINLAIED